MIWDILWDFVFIPYFFPTGLGDGRNRKFILVNHKVVVVISKILEDRM